MRPDNSAVTYGYDPLGQLWEARATNAAGQGLSAESRDYRYDAAWNLRWRTNDGTAQSFLVDTKNDLTNDTVTGGHTFDLNGNLLKSGNGAVTNEFG